MHDPSFSSHWIKTMGALRMPPFATQNQTSLILFGSSLQIYCFDLFVTPEGFEPPTNRTGICHSIQLNYGVKEY